MSARSTQPSNVVVREFFIAGIVSSSVGRGSRTPKGEDLSICINELGEYRTNSENIQHHYSAETWSGAARGGKVAAKPITPQAGWAQNLNLTPWSPS